VIEILMSVKTMVLLKPGCISCDLYINHDQGQNILYIERWQTKEDMYNHIGSNLYLRVLNAMELSNGPPEIFFHEGTETMGMELIKTIRTTEYKNEVG
jgi:quinol monooxygenase YgiN